MPIEKLGRWEFVSEARLEKQETTVNTRKFAAKGAVIFTVTRCEAFANNLTGRRGSLNNPSCGALL